MNQDINIGGYIGPFRIDRELGRGGMGVVYLGIHQQIERRVAIKVLSSAYAAAPAYRDRFIREARICSETLHPGLVQIWDHNRLPNGLPYIVMEYLEGDSLRERLNRHPGEALPLAMALRLSQQIADAVAAAHDVNVIHRDLKPENIVVIPDSAAVGGERCKVLDFGIAKAADEMGSQQALGDPSSDAETSPQPSWGYGTPAYMSPEAIHGGDGRIDGKADVYSLGIILYELLSGRPPFAADTERLKMLHVFEEPDSLAHRTVNVPAEVVVLVMRMLHKDPDERPSMSEVSDRLRALLAGYPLAPEHPERQSRPAFRVGTWLAKKPIMLAVVALVLLICSLAYYELHRRVTETAMVLIPGGSFEMGSSRDEVAAAFHYAQKTHCPECPYELYTREMPKRWVSVSTFWMDATEVTNEQFADWLNKVPVSLKRTELGHLHVVLGTTLLLHLQEQAPVASGIIDESNRFRARKGMERLPVNYVSWEGANHYCLDNGKRLPTEAEWEFAARGAERRTFPWGDEDPNWASVAFGRRPEDMIFPAPRLEPSPVGTMSMDRTKEGIYDLGGNVAEWVADWFIPAYTNCGDCRNPVIDDRLSLPAGTEELRSIRGGSFFRKAEACRAAGRSRTPKESSTYKEERLSGDIGFRCTQSLKP